MIALLLAAATIAQQGDMAVAQDLESTLADRANAGDSTGIGALYALDATLLYPKSAAVTGRGAIEGFWQRAVSDVGALELHTVNISRISPDMIREVGTYSMRPRAGGRVMTGRHLVLWRHTDKGWLIAADSWG